LNNRWSIVVPILSIVLASTILVGLTYANYQYTSNNPGGNDFLSRWVGTRLFLTRGISPYSEQVTRQIQLMAYGREATSGEDQMLFAYPFYTTIIISPFAVVGEYALARALWMTALEVMVILLTFISLSIARWKAPLWLMASLLLFSVTWYYGLRPIINGNPAVFVAVFLALAFMAVRANFDPLAGFLLAISTIKPQMIVLIIPFVLLWAISHRRWTLFWSFAGSLALLIAGFSVFYPDWPIQNIRQILSYPAYTLPNTPGAMLTAWLPGVGKQLGWGITILMVTLIFVEWRAALRKDFRWFLWTACITIAITNLIGIHTATENYVAMFPGLVLVLSIWDERWRKLGQWIGFITMLLLLVGLWLLFVSTIQFGDQPIQHPVMFFPLPVLLIAGLYWVRWWAIHPPRLFLEEFRDSRVKEPV
jgi:hypothetical protein